MRYLSFADFVPVLFFAFFLTLAPGQAQAEWKLRPDDNPLSQAELAALAGQTLTFYDNGQSRYSAGGAYSYTYASGETAFGSYRIAEDGSICTEFKHGFSRCDLYVRAGERLVLITADGLRFPVRPE